MLNSLLCNGLCNIKNSYIPKMDGIYHIVREKVCNKNICSITYILLNTLINIYDHMLYNIYVI